LQDTILVVTGLPRSGTSMMMQMLSAGGIPPLTDGKRRPDALNMNGYFEFEPAINLKRDSSWLPLARGKAVKIVAQLVSHLPADFDYRFIFMEREMDEILQSQSRMLSLRSRDGGDLSVERLGETFSAQVSAVKTMLGLRHMDMLLVSYREAVEKPAEVAKKINAFLGGSLDEARMAAAVDPKLRTVCG
jgi:hypothetical protein